MSSRRRSPQPEQIGRVFGDPGVGGLLSDPLAPRGRCNKPDPEAGPPDPDSPPPRHHGDWLPTAGRKAGKPRSLPHLRLGRGRSFSGMPKALFREDDGTSLDDLRALGRVDA